MPRVDLEKYYNGFFKDKKDFDREEFREINRGHVISSLFYDVHANRDSILYRDKLNKIVIPGEPNIIDHSLSVYFDSCMNENPNCLKGITREVLKKRIDTALSFINVKHVFE